MSSKRNFFDTINLLYIFGKFFGMSCYTISKKQGKYKISFRFFDFVQLNIFIVIYLILIYLNSSVVLNITNGAKNAVLFNSGQRILMLTAQWFLLGGLVKIVLMRNRYWQVVEALIVIDNDMKQLLKIQINHDELYRHTVIFIIVCYSVLFTAYIIFGTYLFIIVNGFIGHYTLSYVVVNSAFVLITNQFQVFMYSIYKRFSLLNEFVGSRIPFNTQQLSNKTASELSKHIFSIARINEKLNNIVPCLSLYFSTFIIPAIAGVFFMTVFNFHNFYRTLSEKYSYDFYYLMVGYEMISLFFNIMLCSSIAVSSMNMNAANKMGVLVNKIISRTNDKDLIIKSTILSQQILHRAPHFSFGLFSLNWPFAYTYVASVAVYLIILIQFENYITENSRNDFLPLANNSTVSFSNI